MSKIDNAGPNARKKWLRYELDGVTPHHCRKGSTRTRSTSSGAASGQRPTDCRDSNSGKRPQEIVNILILQIQMLRSEVKKTVNPFKNNKIESIVR